MDTQKRSAISDTSFSMFTILIIVIIEEHLVAIDLLVQA